jgi:hypothetical protein
LVERVGAGASCQKEEGKIDQERRKKMQTILASS